MSQPITYLDNNATTRIDPAVLDAMLPYLADEYGNPSSDYDLGRRAATAIEDARAALAALIGSRPEEILFTSCGTESINTAILSCAARDPDQRHIITSAVEHSATVRLCEHLARRGYEITWLPVDSQGLLDPTRLRDAIREDTALVTLLLANNETGVLFPIQELAAITAQKKVPLHVDAVQALGKIPVDVATLGAQFVSLSGHKLYCPKGIGALYVDRRTRFEPLLRGSQEEGRRAGTQNVASIVAFGRAAALAAEALPTYPQHIATLRDHFERTILETIPDTTLNGHPTHRLPNTSNLSFQGIDSEAALLLLGERGIYCSAGSACTSGSVHPSHVLRAMGLSTDRARASLRFSLGRFTTPQHIQHATTTLPQIITKLRTLRTPPQTPKP